MDVTSIAAITPVIRKLESVLTLTGEEKAALMRLPIQVTDVRTDQDIVREGDRPSRCFAVLEGFACSFKMTGEGKRQILGFHIPGDIPDLQSLHLDVLDCSIGTLTPCKLGFLRHEPMRELCLANPRLGAAFWRETLVDASIFREWVTNVGRRAAYARLAHVLCELVVRLRAVGLTEDHACELPMTQNELADATGISTVHVNRTLQELRGDNLITLRGEKLTILDWDRLKQAADFDPTYLHLRRTEQVAA
jgi:CRP-like cAMP-binding protein